MDSFEEFLLLVNDLSDQYVVVHVACLYRLMIGCQQISAVLVGYTVVLLV